MSGIDTSRGINSVATTIAALQANGTQTVTTNTGARVTGLEAAAYEFGSILASYPADAPPLARNAAVFQVTDAQGNTSMVSLNDLANDIREQTGFDPLIEFSAGIGATNQGYSVADINYVLGKLQKDYASMTFTPLTVIEINQELQVSGQLNSGASNALGQLGSALQSAIPNNVAGAVINSPGGLDPNANVFVTPGAQSQVLQSQNAVSQLGQGISDDLDGLLYQNANNIIAQIQVGSGPDLPAVVAEDMQELQVAQA